MYFAPKCLFCGKNNARRHTRHGRTWLCKHCGEANPGPGMLKAIVGHFASPPANVQHANGAAQPTPTRAAATTIKGVAKVPVAKPAKAAPIEPLAAKPKPLAPPPPPPPAKRGGLLEGIAARVYG